MFCFCNIKSSGSQAPAKHKSYALLLCCRIEKKTRAWFQHHNIT